MYEVYISKRVLKSIRLLPIPERCGDEMQLHADDEMVDVFETAWYTNLKKQITPGMNLKIYRDNYGLTQNQLGQMLGGFSRRHISHLEHDIRTWRKNCLVFLMYPSRSSRNKHLHASRLFILPLLQ